MITSNQSRAPTPIFNCKQCSYKTTSITSIENHVKYHKFRYLQKSFSCTNCALEPYTCDRCSYKTLFIVNLKKHVKRTHYIKTRGYFKEDGLEKMQKTCKYKSCNFMTYSRLVFLKHAQAKCTGRLKALNRLRIPITDESALTEDGNWLKCDQCPYKSESNFFMTMHVSVEHASSANVDKVEKVESVNFPAEEVKIPVFKQSDDMLTLVEDERETATRCRFCFYEAKDTGDLRTHFLSEHTETTHDAESYSCKKCHYVTKSKKGVQIHMKMKHKEAKNYPCPYCSFKGQRPSSLEQHMWKKYAKHIEWFSCDKCAYKTIFEEALASHRDDHDQEAEGCCGLDGGSGF